MGKFQTAMMDRRQFLSRMIGGVAATAAVRTFPFRVYSFPTEIIEPVIHPFVIEDLLGQLNALNDISLADAFFRESPFLRYLKNSPSEQKWIADGGDIREILG